MAELERLYNQCLKECLAELQTRLGENLAAVILAGSLAKGTLVPGWSDIDLLALCHALNFENLKITGEIKSKLEEKYGIHLGLSLGSVEEFQTERLETNDLKMRSVKQQLAMGIAKVVYGEVGEFYTPTKKDMAKDAVREIAIYRSQLRKTVRDCQGAALLERCIKFGFRVTRLAVEHCEQTPVAYKDTVAHAKKCFPDFPFGFKKLERADRLRNRIKDISDEDADREAQELTDFAEAFVKYFFDKTKT